MKLQRITAVAVSAASIVFASAANGGGTLTPIGSPEQPIQILDHHVSVVINNGFAKTEVLQTFFNPNSVDLEAIYSFPVPTSASLSEVTVCISENEIHGEVLARTDAEQIYEEEKNKGSEAGLASKNGYQDFQFRVTPVRAGDETKIRFVYYQPLEIDTGVGRYVYPLEDGGTDELAQSFWTKNERVENAFSVDIELKSAVPVDSVRIPGFESRTTIDELGEGHFKARIESAGGALNKDVVFYYMLDEDLPGRVELIPYRDDQSGPGTYMLVVTPGIDLQPITTGADYIFVLDTSGSMQNKLHMLAKGVSDAITDLRPDDRFRIILFNDGASDLTRGFLPATPENVSRALARVDRLQARGATNLYDGLRLALGKLDDDRATSVVMVTDGVTNTGVVDPVAFRKLAKKYDVRLFGFLMGNSANWPLVRSICEASGGFYSSVSNSDDIVGQIMLAKSKITNECLHDADLRISGVKTFDSTEGALGKVYRGQQLVMFGRYEQGGRATLRLKARLTGEDKTYTTSFDFPDVAMDNPEIERLWAMNRIEAIEMQEMAGIIPTAESTTAIQDLGVAYQLVTDHTSMLVLADHAFEERGIERRNLDRAAREHAAQGRRAAQTVQPARVDTAEPMFDEQPPHVGKGGGGGGAGGGALDPISGSILLGLGGLAASRRRRSEKG